MTTFVRAGLIALLAGVSLSACERRTAPSAPALGAAAPAFTAMTLEGAPVTLAALSGSVVVMNATGRWAQLPTVERLLCMPCFHLQPP